MQESTERGGGPQNPIAEPDEPDRPLRGPRWAQRELRADDGDDDRATKPGRRVADEDRRRTPNPAGITDHAP